MIVFRFETRDGVGVYGVGLGYKCSAVGLIGSEVNLPEPLLQHVGPGEDTLLSRWWHGDKLRNTKLYEWVHRDRKEWFCGFSSLEQLKEWFPKVGVERMIQLNARQTDPVLLSVYEVKPSKVKSGVAQVMFHMPSADFVERMELREVLEMFG